MALCAGSPGSDPARAAGEGSLSPCAYVCVCMCVPTVLEKMPVQVTGTDICVCEACEADVSESEQQTREVLQDVR